MRAGCAFALLLLATQCAAFDWKDCGAGATAFKVESVTLSPEPVNPGATANFNIKATSGVEVTAGKIAMSVAYSGLPIWTQTDDLCAKMTCPAAAGPVTVTFEQRFPIITPPGSYAVTLRGADAADKPLFCVAVDFAVVLGLRTAVDRARQSLLRTGHRLLRIGQTA